MPEPATPRTPPRFDPVPRAMPTRPAKRSGSRLLTKVKRPRPLLVQLDKLKEERTEIAVRMEADQRGQSVVAHTGATDAQLHAFVHQYRSGVHEGSAVRRKAVTNSLIQKAILDGDQLTVVSNLTPLIGVSLASPRRFRINPRKKIVTTDCQPLCLGVHPSAHFNLDLELRRCAAASGFRNPPPGARVSALSDDLLARPQQGLQRSFGQQYDHGPSALPHQRQCRQIFCGYRNREFSFRGEAF